MKHQPKLSKMQLNLGLHQPVPTEVPAGKERELNLALAELLLTAAEDVFRDPIPAKEGGSNESEADS